MAKGDSSVADIRSYLEMHHAMPQFGQSKGCGKAPNIFLDQLSLRLMMLSQASLGAANAKWNVELHRICCNTREKEEFSMLYIENASK